MSERIEIGYRRLFEIRLLHHFWLDEGWTVFDLISDQGKKAERLISYDVRSFLAIAPTEATERALRGYSCLYRESASGCLVAVPDRAVIPDDALLEFAVTIRNSAFFDYTALTLGAQSIFEIYHETEERTYRFKENVPLLTNLTGASRGSGEGKALFLSGEYPAPAADDKAESLVRSGYALMQLTGDQPGAGLQQINSLAADMPVFVNQGDVPNIVPPAGLSGAPEKGIMLAAGIPDEIFALVRLAAKRPDDPDYSLVDVEGHGKARAPIFQIRFRSRSTVRNYMDRSSGATLFTEAQPIPMTFHGNGGARQKPSGGPIRAEKSGETVTRLVSDIFV
jgi:hypothetical protein